MKSFKQFLFLILGIIFVLCSSILVLDYFGFFTLSKFDLPNRYVKENAPIIIAGTVGVADLLEDIAYKNTIGVPSDFEPVHPYYKTITCIGLSNKLNLPLIKKMKADFYIADKSVKNKTDYLFAENNIKNTEIKYLDFSTYENYLNSIIEIGELCNKEKEANHLVQTIEAKILEMRRASYGIESPRVLVLIHRKDGVFAETKYSFVGSLLDSLNIENIANVNEKVKSPYVFFNLKNLLDLKPDIIISIFENDFDIFAEDKLNYSAVQSELLYQSQVHILREDYSCTVYDLDNEFFEESLSLRLPYLVKSLKDKVYIEKK